MDKHELEEINNILRAQEWLQLTEAISQESEDFFHHGKIAINTAKAIIYLNVCISADFPLGKIEFICTSHIGYFHEMHSGLLCLNAAPAATLPDRLELELEKLQVWVDRYFIKEEKDEHFEYYQFLKPKNIELIFEEDQQKDGLKSSYGKFNYGLLNSFTIQNTELNTTWIAFDVGGRKCRWSEQFLSKIVGKHIGLWVKISGHPVNQGRHTIESWVDFLKLIDQTQAKFIYDESKIIAKRSGYSDSFLLLAGYDIPAESGIELHWDLIAVPFDKFPYSARKIKSGQYEPEDLGHQVGWCKTTNASYLRLFGRGKLTDSLTGSKILVIGTGAIGSSLFLALVRGGCIDIEISDLEDIDPGNMCRGQFSFTDSGKPKIYELGRTALSLSPYLNLEISTGIKPMAKNNSSYEKQLKRLQQFDYLFDCSTDKYISMMLDQMELKGQIINISISNEANHMAVISGKGNIHIIKSQLFSRLVPGKRALFFIATGCWHPTFQASFSDINVLLMYALSEMNQRLKNYLPVNSFYISKKINEQHSLFYDISYQV